MAVVYTHRLEHHPIIFKEAVTKFGTSYQSELEGIRITLEQTTLSLADALQPAAVHIFFNCQSAITTVSAPGIETSEHLATNIRSWTLVKHLKDKGISCRISWVCGHEGLQPNELANSAAREAASIADEEQALTTHSAADVKATLRQHLTEKWQLSWDQGHTARELYSIIPTVRLKPRTYWLSRSAETKLNRL